MYDNPQAESTSILHEVNGSGRIRIDKLTIESWPSKEIYTYLILIWLIGYNGSPSLDLWLFMRRQHNEGKTSKDHDANLRHLLLYE